MGEDVSPGTTNREDGRGTTTVAGQMRLIAEVAKLANEERAILA